MEIVHLRQDCASCSQNLGGNESPEFLPSTTQAPLSAPALSAARYKLLHNLNYCS